MPTCIGIIMDGNRRWAKQRGLPTLEGHQQGYETLKRAAEWCRDMDVHHLVVYAFSTENWNRSKEEVGYLMDLMRVLLHERLDAPHKPDEAIHIVGDHARFPQDIQDLISKLHSRNVPTAAFHFWVCASYGGKSEILSAVHALLAQQKNTVTEEEFTSALWTARMPNPDIIIRTGGEKRLSNFLLWRSGYSELFFLDTYWPDFSKEELETVIAEFAGRKRNYGK